MGRILTVIGTRPEVIKMAPVLRQLQAAATLESRVCVTGQHREMTDSLLELFHIRPDIDLDLMAPSQTLPDLTSRVLTEISAVLEVERPSCVLIQGDTTTVLATALASFYMGIPIAHVEAGLRTHHLHRPFPEEMNRRVTAVLADVHFAPTQRAVDALRRESIDAERIVLTGNPVIDALRWILDQPMSAATSEFMERYGPIEGERLVLVTAHRRESFGAPLLSICRGLRRMVERNPDVRVVYPVHLNPNVRSAVDQILAGHDRIQLLEPLPYDTFCRLMNRAHLILTDSGGVQEEAPALGKPVLVLRDDTERPEAVDAGTVEIIGTSEERIVQAAERLLRDDDLYRKRSAAVSPYGDGYASNRIVEQLVTRYGQI